MVPEHERTAPDELPPIRYARSGDLTIAYQVLGDGPFDLVWVPGLCGHLELEWEDPREARLFRRLAAFSRFIRFDKRGTGLSERIIGVPTLEERMEDVRIVMDAVGSERAALLGVSEGGPMSIMFAASYPDRTLALVLYGTFAKITAEAGYEGYDTFEPVIEGLTGGWGTGASLDLFARKWASNERARAQMARVERAAASPRSVRATLEAIAAIDVRPILPTIAVPTLVVSRTDDHTTPPCLQRYLAEHVPGAQYFEQPGEHLPGSGDVDALADRIEAFLTGRRSEVIVDRVLATVLFSDVVGSTEQASALGDRRWRALLDDHDALVRACIGSHRGTLVKSTGDGALATFDGPARAIRCGREIRDGVRGLGMDVRVGLHTGEIELRGTDVGGIAVHIGARVAALADPGEVLVSRTVKDLVAGSGLAFVDRGLHPLKGVADTWQLYALAG
jgi:class 3 adenylate cyclase/alpha-beta hydrolase superfamily lysophospholipase